jgi:hypothetical protein
MQLHQKTMIQRSREKTRESGMSDSLLDGRDNVVPPAPRRCVKNPAPGRATTAILAATATTALTLALAGFGSSNAGAAESLAGKFDKIVGGADIVDDTSGEFAIYDYTSGTTGSTTYAAWWCPDDGITPASYSTAQTLVVEFDLRLTLGNGDSIGVYFVNSANSTQNVIALFNTLNRNTEANGKFRTGYNCYLATASFQNPGNELDAQTVPLVNGDKTNWTHWTVTFSVGASNTPEISLTMSNLANPAGNYTCTYTPTLAAGLADWANTSVALRLYDTSGWAGDDINIRNFEVYSIPEFSTTSAFFGFVAMTAAGAAFGTARRHRRVSAGVNVVGE